MKQVNIYIFITLKFKTYRFGKKYIIVQIDAIDFYGN